MTNTRKIIHGFINSDGPVNINWIKPDFKSESSQYFEDTYAQTFMASHGIDFKNQTDMANFLKHGSLETISKKVLSNNYDNLTINDEDFDFELKEPKYAEVYNKMEEDLEKGPITFQAPILIKAHGTYFALSGNKRCNLAFRKNIPVQFWVVPAYKAWRETTPGTRRRMASSIINKWSKASQAV